MIAASTIVQILIYHNLAYSAYGFWTCERPNTTSPFDESNVNLPWFNDTWLVAKQVKTRKLLDYKCECGIENSEEGSGQEVYPWMVWITFWQPPASDTEPPQYQISCLGTLINSIMILTNAPCVNKFKFALNKASYQWEYQRINVYLNMDPPSPLPDKSIPIENVFFHPQYSKGNLDFDVALIKLKKQVPFNDPKNAIRPICIPAMQDKEKIRKTMTLGGQLGVVLLQTTDLTYSEKVIVQNGDAATQYPMRECEKMFKEKIHGSFICAQPKLLQPSMAQSHFGGPIYQALYNDYDIQVGIWSSRHFGVRKKEESSLNLFIDILDIVPFIEDVSKTEGARWCRHTRIKFNDNLPDHRLPKEKTPWIGHTSKNRELNPTCGCGYRKTQQQSRIVGGHAALPYTFPWLASLEVSSGNVGSSCGAAVINDLFILTAAHCVFDQDILSNDPDIAYPGSAVDILQVNILKHETRGDEREVRLEIEEVFLHPEYTQAKLKPAFSMDYDIALLKVSSRLDFWNEDGPMPICLPSTDEVLDLFGKEGIVAGWGMINPDDPEESPTELQQIEIPIRSLQDCRNMTTQPITNRMMCAGTFDPRKDTLHGDSGGPLMFELPTKQIMEVGIVSWGDYDFRVSNYLDTEQAAALYTNVQSVLDYIDYYSELHEAKWCNRNLPAENVRKPWLGAKLPPRNNSKTCACGNFKETPSLGNIVHNDSPNEMPWLVLIMTVRGSKTDYCTGSIINDLFIITSAECVKADEILPHVKPSLPLNVIHIQRMPLFRNFIDFQASLKVDSIHIHPAYFGEGMTDFDHDIALIKLKHPINFVSDKLSPVCVPTAQEFKRIDTVLGAGNMAGWWVQKENEQVSLEFLRNSAKPEFREIEACGKQEYLGHPRNFICAETAEIENGLAGGPILVRENDKPFYQVGILPVPSKEQKVSCIGVKKKPTVDADVETNAPPPPVSDAEESPAGDPNEVYPDDDDEIKGRSMGLMINPLKVNITNNNGENKTLPLEDEDGESVDDFWKDDDDLGKTRLKRSNGQECSMYTSISEVLDFIEFFASSYGATWCNGDVKEIAENQEPDDFGLIR